MEELTHSPLFAVTITFLVYWGSSILYKRTNFFLLHPVLVSIATLIGILLMLDIPYEEYNEGGKLISAFLKPAVVALGYPLYLKIEEIRKDKTAIVISVLVGSFTGVVSGVVLAILFGATPEVVLSLAPKSVTTPIAMGIAEKIGGVPALTAVIVIIVGIFGAIVGVPLMKICKIYQPKAMGLAMGAAAHGVGTAQIAQQGKVQAAYGGLALGLCGIITAIITPFLVPLIIRLMESF